MSRRRLGLRKRLALNIFSDLYSSAVAEHRLDRLFWECTLRCNLSCRHCGSDCRVDPGVRDMPIEDFLKVLDEEVTPHVDPAQVLVIFSGGEVLVRPDLERAGAEVTRRGYAWGMVTNGLGLTESRFRGTKAAAMPDQVPEAVKKERSEKLLALGHRMSEEFRRYYLGRQVTALLEEEFLYDGKRYYTGYTKEYVKVAVETEKDLSNTFVTGTLKTQLTEDIYLLVEF